MVRVVNYSGVTHRLRPDQYLGKAEPVETIGEEGELGEEGYGATVDHFPASFPTSQLGVIGPRPEEVPLTIMGDTCPAESSDSKREEEIPDHLRCLAEALPEDLSVEQRDQAIRFLSQNADLFSRS